MPGGHSCPALRRHPGAAPSAGVHLQEADRSATPVTLTRQAPQGRCRHPPALPSLRGSPASSLALANLGTDSYPGPRGQPELGGVHPWRVLRDKAEGAAFGGVKLLTRLVGLCGGDGASCRGHVPRHEGEQTPAPGSDPSREALLRGAASHAPATETAETQSPSSGPQGTLACRGLRAGQPFPRPLL